jgi:hypothetical protein
MKTPNAIIQTATPRKSVGGGGVPDEGGSVAVEYWSAPSARGDPSDAAGLIIDGRDPTVAILARWKNILRWGLIAQYQL